MKTTRRILSVMLAVMLVLALSVTVSAASGTGNLQITGDDGFGGAKVTAVQMFKDVSSNPGEITYELSTGWAGFFTGKNVATGTEYTYVSNLSGDDLVNFAADAKAYYNAHKSDFTSVYTATAAGNTATPANTATFAGLDAGSYLVLPASGSKDENRPTDAMLVNVIADETTSMAIKTKYPTVEKEVETNTADTFADDTAAGVGDTVNFKLTSAVPDMSDYTTYKFNFVDTMSTGLTYVPDSVKVTIGSKTDEDLTGSYTVDWTNQVLIVAFADLKSVNGIQTDDAITVTYSATVNENAVVGTSTNSAKVQYSNNPGEDSLGESTPDITTVYTYDMIIDKYTLAADGITHTQLANAVFEIYDVDPTTEGAAPMNFVAVAGETDTYRVAKSDDTTTVTTVTTPENGQITIKGLDDKTYYVKETSAPSAEYNLADVVTVEIEQDGTSANYTVDGTDQDNNNKVGVLNVKGILLPTTGSVGTIIFTVLGAGVIIAGVMFTSRKKKEDK